jgi:hypothetical protein
MGPPAVLNIPGVLNESATPAEQVDHRRIATCCCQDEWCVELWEGLCTRISIIRKQHQCDGQVLHIRLEVVVPKQSRVLPHSALEHAAHLGIERCAVAVSAEDALRMSVTISSCCQDCSCTDDQRQAARQLRDILPVCKPGHADVWIAEDDVTRLPAPCTMQQQAANNSAVENSLAMCTCLSPLFPLSSLLIKSDKPLPRRQQQFSKSQHIAQAWLLQHTSKTLACLATGVIFDSPPA